MTDIKSTSFDDTAQEQHILDALKLNGYLLAKRIFHELSHQEKQKLQGSKVEQEIPLDFGGGAKADLILKALGFLNKEFMDTTNDHQAAFHFCIEVKYSNEFWLITKQERFQDCFNIKLGFFLHGTQDECIPICTFHQKGTTDFPTFPLPVSSNLFIGRKKNKRLEFSEDCSYLFQVLKQHYGYAFALSRRKESNNVGVIVIPVLLTNAPIFELLLEPSMINAQGGFSAEGHSVLNRISGAWMQADFFLSGQEYQSDQRSFVSNAIRFISKTKMEVSPNRYRPSSELVYVMNSDNLRDNFSALLRELGEIMPEEICRKIPASNSL